VDENTESAKANDKGRPTPSRKEAEAARKKAMKTPMTRKEQMKREREARAMIRERQQEALKSGDEKFLPLRDRGPVRRFTRDYIDRRRLVAEYLLPILILAFIVTTLPPPWAGIGLLMWVGTTLLTIVDEFFLIRRLKKELARRFPDESKKGITLYTLLRSTQLRRWRLPKPQIDRGAPLPERY
jgi:Flp pilus assembly protein TadB